METMGENERSISDDKRLLCMIRKIANMTAIEFESLKEILLKNNEHELCDIMTNMRGAREG